LQDESRHLSLATCHFEDCNAKAELNHRSQACEVLTGTGVRVAKIGLPSRSLGEGRSSIRVARPVFRFGLPSVALSPNKTSPPSHKAMEGILRSDSTKVGSERRMEDRRVSLNTYARQKSLKDKCRLQKNLRFASQLRFVNNIGLPFLVSDVKQNPAKH